MLFSIIIVIILLLAIWRGWRKGLVRELFSFIGFLIAAIIAFIYVQPVATFLRTLSNKIIETNAPTNTIFWLALSFITTLIVAGIILKLISNLLGAIVSLPILKQLNKIAGAILAFIGWWLVICLILNGLILLNNNWIDSQYAHSEISQTVTMNTPKVFQQFIKH